MGNFRIMTCGDGNYFEFLRTFERNVSLVFRKLPVIYDLGMSEGQRGQLRSEVRRVPVPADYASDSSGGCVKATHKPDCVLDCLSNAPDDCLYADADILFTAPITPEEFRGADLAVTPRHPEELRKFKPNLENGLINSGIMYFRNVEPVHSLVRTWRERCLDEDTTDQRAMSDILSESVALLHGPEEQRWNDLRVRLLNPEVYNDVACRTGKAMHFKNAGRHGRQLQQYRRFARFQALFPRVVRVLTGIRRRRLAA